MPKQVDPQEKRRALIAACIELIAIEGLPATTLRRVAQQAGCTTGTLTHYFANRDELLISTLRTVHRQAAQRMQDIARAEHNPALHLQRVLEESLPLHPTALQEWKVWLTFWASSMTSTALTQENTKRYAEWRHLLSTLLQDVNNQLNVELESRMLVSFVDGLGVTVARQSGLKPIQAAQQECRELLAGYLQRLLG